MTVWRRPTRADDRAWLGLLHAIDAGDGRGERMTQKDVDDEWASLWAHPATDAIFGWHGDHLVAFGWLKVQLRRGDRHRIACWGGVHPDLRGRGIGTALLDRQLARAAEVAPTLEPGWSTVAEVEVLDTQPALRALLVARGFEPAGRLLELARPLAAGAAPVPDAPVPDGLVLRGWRAELDEPTRLAHNAAFEGQKVGEPHPRELWRQWLTGHRSFCPELTRVVTDGNEVVGYVLAATYPADWHHAGGRELWLTTVGTRPSRRRSGVARAAVAAVLRAARDEGFGRAILGVDAGNPTGAVELYRSLGFVDLRATTTYSRAVSRGTASAGRCLA
jgi:ribosomal protein S18 acetylase RimI-like enzyme